MLLFYIIALSTVVLYNSTTIRKKWQDYKRLNKLVATKHSGFFNIHKVSLEMVFEKEKIRFMNWLDKRVSYIDKNTAVVSYSLNDKDYKIVIKIPRGPSKVTRITGENDVDMLAEVLPYLGPSLDCHGYQLTPDFFNEEYLVITYLGQDFVFSANEPIRLK